VIFNHGAGDDGLCWTRVAKELEKDYDVIMVDARGHGMTSSGTGDYSTASRVEDLAGLIRELKLDRPAVGGQSLGADTSVNFAASHPELTRGIFLEDPPIILPGEKSGDEKQELKVEDIGKMMAKFFRIFKIMPKFIAVPMARKGSPTYPDDEIIPWVNAKKRLNPDFFKAFASTLGMDVADPFAVFKKVSVPILLIIGDKEKMSIVSPESAQKAVEANPKVQVIRLEGASHDIRRTRFDGYMPALKKFLEEIYRS
jgi:N-formylmaleamate deformylase